MSAQVEASKQNQEQKIRFADIPDSILRFSSDYMAVSSYREAMFTIYRTLGYAEFMLREPDKFQDVDVTQRQEIQEVVSTAETMLDKLTELGEDGWTEMVRRRAKAREAEQKGRDLIRVHPTRKVSTGPKLKQKNPEKEFEIDLGEPEDFDITIVIDPDKEKMQVSEALNFETSKIFVKNLRENTSRICRETGGQPENKEYYVNNGWYSNLDLKRLADRWNLPIFVLSTHRHFKLVLEKPIRRSGRWQALVYDPMIGGETWTNVSGDWQTCLRDGSAIASDLAIRQLWDDEYEMSLEDDKEYAMDEDVYRAKQVSTQDNTWDCGPLCLFAAALREGAKPEFNAFKFSGREQLAEDTKVMILAREEIEGIRERNDFKIKFG